MNAEASLSIIATITRARTSALVTIIPTHVKAATTKAAQIDFSDAQEISWNQWGLQISGRQSTHIGPQTIKAGQLHFILGESGVGKSTFALNLLGITHDAQISVKRPDGEFLLSPEHTDSWFKALGWIPQLPQLAHATVREQFKFISGSVTDDQIKQELSRCGLDVAQLPLGLETIVGGSGEGTSEASGGQIRKIAVARALFSHPRILVAEESVAKKCCWESLDPTRERSWVMQITIAPVAA